MNRKILTGEPTWPNPFHSLESICGVSLAHFPHVLSRKEYAEARKSRRCGEAGRLAQAQVQTTPPRGKAGRSETEHRPRCWPRLATSFTCLASCSMHPRVSSTSLLLLHPRWNLLMHLYDVTLSSCPVVCLGKPDAMTTSLQLTKISDEVSSQR